MSRPSLTSKTPSSSSSSLCSSSFSRSSAAADNDDDDEDVEIIDVPLSQRLRQRPIKVEKKTKRKRRDEGDDDEEDEDEDDDDDDDEDEDDDGAEDDVSNYSLSPASRRRVDAAAEPFGTEGGRASGERCGGEAAAGRHRRAPQRRQLRAAHQEGQLRHPESRQRLLRTATRRRTGGGGEEDAQHHQSSRRQSAQKRPLPGVQVRHPSAGCQHRRAARLPRDVLRLHLPSLFLLRLLLSLPLLFSLHPKARRAACQPVGPSSHQQPLHPRLRRRRLRL